MSAAAMRGSTLPNASRFTAGVFIILIVAIAATGGSSRFDSLAQVVVRLVSIAAIAALLIRRAPFALELKPALILIGAMIALTAMQLVPLPPAIWHHLPGRDLYASIDAMLGLGSLWRPMSVTPDLTMNAAFFLLTPLAVLLSLGALGRERRSFGLWAFAAVVATSAVLGILQLAGGAASPLRYYALSGDGAVGLLANRNHAGLVLATGFPLLALIWLRLKASERTIATGSALLVAAALLGAVVLVNGSRAGLGLSLLGAIGAAVLIVREHPVGRRAALLALGAAAVAALGLFALVATFRTTVVARWQTLDAGDLRADILPVLLDMARHFAPIGSGFGSFEAVYRQFERLDDLRLQYLNAAHNDYLQIVIEGGVGAVALFVAFVAIVVPRAVAAWRGPNAGERRMARAATLIIAQILLASIVDYPLRTSLVATLFAIAVTWLLLETGGNKRLYARHGGE
jgi:O-antigen ligase